MVTARQAATIREVVVAGGAGVKAEAAVGSETTVVMGPAGAVAEGAAVGASKAAAGELPLGPGHRVRGRRRPPPRHKRPTWEAPPLARLLDTSLVTLVCVFVAMLRMPLSHFHIHQRRWALCGQMN